jgi:hypothetical protein
MRFDSRPLVAGTLVAGVLLAAALALAGFAQEADTQDPRPHCCFANPRYAGTCEVEPAKDETCASILEYLNNPMSQGKPYCNSTNLRGGWKQEPCEPGMKSGSSKAKPE